MTQNEKQPEALTPEQNEARRQERARIVALLKKGMTPRQILDLLDEEELE